jgi:hypothetical protein
MSEHAISPAEPADLIEQSLDLVPDDDTETPTDLPWESDPADLLEQQRAVGVDDERDEDHQA